MEVNAYLFLIISSATPMIESRYAFPVAVSLGLNPFLSLFLSLLSNFSSAAASFLLLKRFWFLLPRRVIESCERRKRVIERYGYAGLFAFILVPIPFTGAYTSSVIAFLLNLDTRKYLITLFFSLLSLLLLELLALYSALSIIK